MLRRKIGRTSKGHVEVLYAALKLLASEDPPFFEHDLLRYSYQMLTITSAPVLDEFVMFTSPITKGE